MASAPRASREKEEAADMETRPANLQQIKGIGRVLDKRLHEAGLNDFRKVAEAGREGLAQIRGITPQNLNLILEQAKELSSASPAPGKERLEAMKRRLDGVKEKVHDFTEAARQRFQEGVSEKYGKKISCELVRLAESLEKLEKCGKKRCKRAAKALVKVEKRLSGLEEASVKKVKKGLKKARKTVTKAL
jgi:hypothetical protein